MLFFFPLSVQERIPEAILHMEAKGTKVCREAGNEPLCSMTQISYIKNDSVAGRAKRIIKRLIFLFCHDCRRILSRFHLFLKASGICTRRVKIDNGWCRSKEWFSIQHPPGCGRLAKDPPGLRGRLPKGDQLQPSLYRTGRMFISLLI